MQGRKLNLGARNQQILKAFRKVARTHIEMFQARRNHISDLLGPHQPYHIGTFREDLLIQFFVDLLPQSVSVDTGFIYGFEEVETSRQLDIIIWDSARHSPVYRTPRFVIVAPEAVIAVITVKTNLGKNDINDALTNITSTVALDMMYRGRVTSDVGDTLCPPILKFVMSYSAPANEADVLSTTASFFGNLISVQPVVAKPLTTSELTALALRGQEPRPGITK